MLEQIEQIKKEAKEKLDGVFSDAKALAESKIAFLGKNGKITALLKNMKDLPADQRPQAGKLLNDLRREVEEIFKQVEDKIAKANKERKLLKEKIDVTLSVDKQNNGKHPITLIKNEIIDTFIGMGFNIFEGPEIELDKYNFQKLNIPKDHPARDMQDTFYVSDNVVLRTQTSAGQVRVMEKEAPPLKILSPGRVFRSDSDASHSPMFHQMEGLVVDKNVTLCDLKGMLEEFLSKIFNGKVKTRFRPSYFPFTEPSVEVDVSCFECGGKGCPLCKKTGWIEVLGAGIVNRKVLEGCNIDPDVYSGFAFGIGIERIAMLKYQIPDIRLFFENDIRFLKQFK